MLSDKQTLTADMLRIFRECGGNVVPADIALEGCAGLVMFDEPVFGVSSAADGIYKEFKKPGVVGEDFMLPDEWLPGAKSVISFFLPFTVTLTLVSSEKNLSSLERRFLISSFMYSLRV